MLIAKGENLLIFSPAASCFIDVHWDAMRLAGKLEWLDAEFPPSALMSRFDSAGSLWSMAWAWSLFSISIRDVG
jgi:hypothetical protein